MPTEKWNNFLTNIEVARRKVSASGKGSWYRGHRNGAWKLTPTLHRSVKGLDREETLYTEVINRGAEYISSANNEWQVVALMQHHGVPTRLLDWTENLYIALYFALSGNLEKPCIWVCNPYLMSAKAAGEKYIYDFSDDPDSSYTKLFKSAGTWPYECPVPICSPWTHRRIENQKGFFTVHGNNPDDLSTIYPRFTKKVDIPAEVIGDAKEHLKEIGIDKYAIFHDFDSLAYVLKEKYELK